MFTARPLPFGSKQRIARRRACGMMASARNAVRGARTNMDAKPIQLLLLEDNPGDARLIRELLKEVGGAAFEVTPAGRLEEARQAVAARSFDIILTDLTLPDSRGLEAFRSLRIIAPTTPVVVLSGVDDEELAISAVREGAQDYLAKSRLEPHLLGRAIRYAIERQHAEEKLISSEAFYHSLVEHLPLRPVEIDCTHQHDLLVRRDFPLLDRDKTSRLHVPKLSSVKRIQIGSLERA